MPPGRPRGGGEGDGPRSPCDECGDGPGCLGSFGAGLGECHGAFPPIAFAVHQGCVGPGEW